VLWRNNRKWFEMRKLHLALDCNGVLFDYNAQMYAYMRSLYPNVQEELMPKDQHPRTWPFLRNKEEFIKAAEGFFKSDYFMQITPIDDSIKGLEILASEGHCISVISNAGQDTTDKLTNIFRLRGGGVFVTNEVICIGLHESKKEYLAKIEPHVFIDDGPQKLVDSLDVASIQLRILFTDQKNPKTDLRLRALMKSGIKIAHNWIPNIVREVRTLADSRA